MGWLRKIFGTDKKADTKTPRAKWLEDGDNRWGGNVLDVRPITLGMLSMSKDPTCAANAMSFAADDGLGFVGQRPAIERRVECALDYPLAGGIADGALFIPREMEEKWALYLHSGSIYCIRSWTRQVCAVASARVKNDRLWVRSIDGSFSGDDSEDSDLTVRIFDFLVRSHASGEVLPAPIPFPTEIPDEQLDNAALLAFTMYGRLALLATAEALTRTTPELALRTDTLLHIAVARGDRDAAKAQIDAGVSVHSHARDGLTPLHWALAREDTGMLDWLLDKGAEVDVRSIEGATALMNATQDGDPSKVACLLDRGADPNAVDDRGFTCLHRAAELGHLETTRLLLDAGAKPDVEAEGYTPLSLAEMRENTEVANLLRNP